MNTNAGTAKKDLRYYRRSMRATKDFAVHNVTLISPKRFSQRSVPEHQRGRQRAFLPILRQDIAEVTAKGVGNSCKHEHPDFRYT
jgi:hypothetical protein